MSKTGVIRGINGPIVHVKGDPGFTMNEMVYVGHDNLVGEVIGLKAGDTIIQVYEETAGIRPGELVTGTGAPVSVTLAPGILTNIFDGIERPLSEIAKTGGAYISRVGSGTGLHKVMVPPDKEGYVLDVVEDGEYTISDPLVTIQHLDGSEETLTMTQKWPIRVARPTAKRFPATRPLITGQRILDTLFPLAKGGTAAIPGGFGTGKTMTQHQIAKWSDANIII